MDIDTDQLKAALDSDILILDCRRDGKYRIIFLNFLWVFIDWVTKVIERSRINPKLNFRPLPIFVQPLTWMFLFLNFYKSFKNMK